jgi:hypothetical protein
MTTVQRLQRIEKKFDSYIGKVEKPCWVKVGFVTAKTGWGKEKMRQAREQGLIEFEHRENGFWYNINSLNPIFLLK